MKLTGKNRIGTQRYLEKHFLLLTMARLALYCLKSNLRVGDKRGDPRKPLGARLCRQSESLSWPCLRTYRTAWVKSQAGSYPRSAAEKIRAAPRSGCARSTRMPKIALSSAWLGAWSISPIYLGPC